MEDLTYEKALAELQGIVNAMESGETSIDDLSAKVERAAELIRFCQEKLRQTNEKINTLFEEN
jgi:exodeoxyribonuclease VII small subunit